MNIQKQWTPRGDVVRLDFRNSKPEQDALNVRNYWEKQGLTGENAPLCFVQTFGCQQNEADGERMAGLARLMGYGITDDPNKALLILVNTCAVREHAEKKALSIIGQYKHCKDADERVLIGVGGCMTSQPHRAEKLKMSYPYVSFVFDTGALHTLPTLVRTALKGKRSFELSGQSTLAENVPTERKISFTAWLSIMYGCNNFCSYCVVPYTRGRERSRMPAEILAEAKELIAGGAKDITLLGQNVNSYGNDLNGIATFSQILAQVAQLDGDFRLRFMTSNPKDVPEELMRVIAAEPKIARHLHLPIQSGSDSVLKRMNRRYDSEKYLSIVQKLREYVPDIRLTTDIIVGFPGETEEEFSATLDILRKVRYDAIFSFIYSPRVGTPAAVMPDQIPHEVSAERFARLLEVQNEISKEQNEQLVGRTLRVLAEEVSHTDTGKLTGRGDSPRPIHFTADPSLIGSFVNVKITGADTFSLNAEVTE